MASTPFDFDNPSWASPALRQVLGRAYLLSTKSSEATKNLHLSFTTLLSAFLISKDPLSRAFQEFCTKTNVNTDAIPENRSIPHDWLDKVRLEKSPERNLDEIQNITVSGENLINDAQRLARKITKANGDQSLDVRHLMGAFIYYPGNHGAQLGIWGINREKWSAVFISHLRKQLPDNHQEFAAWEAEHEKAFGNRDALLLSPPIGSLWRLSGFDSDHPTGMASEDYLNIKSDVNALAALIAAKETKPPLAIGIFGDWGTGKTFFMRRLVKTVDRLSAAARGEVGSKQEALQKDISYFKRIVQIEFNAWHYMDADLWASLVENIFTNLRISQDPKWDPDGTQLRTLQENLLRKVETVNQEHLQLQRMAQQIRREAKVKCLEIERKRRENQEKMEALSLENVGSETERSMIVSAAIEALTEAGYGNQVAEIKYAGERIVDLWATLQEARSVLEHGSAIFTPMAQAPDRRWRFGWFLFILVLGPALGLLLVLVIYWINPTWLNETLTALVGQATALASIAAGLATWIRAQVEWTKENLSRMEAVNHQFLDLQAAQEQAMSLLKQEAANLNTEYQAAAQAAQEALHRAQSLQIELKTFGPVPVLTRFLRDRTESDDYRKHLGLLALVRRDFQTLNDYIEEINNQLEKNHYASIDDERRDAEKGINRIVLYIDDLDRCPPENVAQVLQAVHLLLALPLFIVVVGVDSRWVSRAIGEYYGKMLAGESSTEPGSVSPERSGIEANRATPQDYLEKIFQIPIWLEPMDEQDTRGMLTGLLARTLKMEADEESAPGTALGGSRGRENEGGPEANGSEASSLPEQSPEPSEVEEVDLTPEALEIVADELEFMKSLWPLLGRSPRAVKRFINTYRLLKTTLAQSEKPLALEDDGYTSDYKVSMFLLAIVTGLPEISRTFFSKLSERTDPPRKVKELVNELEKGGEPQEVASLRRIRSWLESEDAGDMGLAPVSVFELRAKQVARYSFRIGFR